MASVEFVVKGFEGLQHLLHVRGRVDQVGDAEVIGVLLLAESASWHCHDTCLVDHLHAVDKVRLLALRVGIVDELLGEVDAGEAIHCTFDLSARDLLHLVKGVGQKLSSFLHSIEDVLLLAVVLFDALT